MKIHLLKLKAELKVLAVQIRTLKSKRKELKGYVPGLYSSQEEARTKHIAYCLLRGRKLEEIENKLRDPKDYTHARVRKAAAKIVAQVLEASKQSETLEKVNGKEDICVDRQDPVALATVSPVGSRINQLRQFVFGK